MNKSLDRSDRFRKPGSTPGETIKSAGSKSARPGEIGRHALNKVGNIPVRVQIPRPRKNSALFFDYRKSRKGSRLRKQRNFHKDMTEHDPKQVSGNAGPDIDPNDRSWGNIASRIHHPHNPFPPENRTIFIPEDETIIRNYSYAGNERLGTVTIPEGVTSIGIKAFYGCVHLKKVILPESLASIGIGAFMHCRSLSEIDLPESVTRIETLAFSSCRELVRIKIPPGLSSLSPLVFNDCISLSSVILPEGLIEIGNRTFAGCGNLSSITIPESVTKIRSGAFRNCGRLTLRVHRDSCAEEYCSREGLRYEVIGV